MRDSRCNLQPFHSNRLYFGFEFPLVEELGATTGDVSTGLELRLTRKTWYAFAAAKRYAGFSNADVSVLGGGGVDLFDAVQIETQAAHVPYDAAVAPQINNGQVETWEVAGRSDTTVDYPSAAPTDFSRYTGDPARFEELLAPEVYDDALSISVGAEVQARSTSGLVESAQQVVLPGFQGALTSATTGAAELEARGKWRTTRADLRLQYQSAGGTLLSFHDDVVLPSTTATRDALDATLALDHHFVRTGLTPGVLVELFAPAAFAPNATPGPLGPVPLQWTVLSTYGFEPMGVGENPRPILRLGGSLRWDIWHFSLLAEASWTHNRNLPDYTSPFVVSDGVSEPVDSTQLGVVVQGRSEETPPPRPPPRLPRLPRGGGIHLVLSEQTHLTPLPRGRRGRGRGMGFREAGKGSDAPSRTFNTRLCSRP